MANTTYQVILSSDGKHTVIVSSDEQAAIDAALQWQQATYDRLVARYGLKGEQRRKNGETVEAAPQCAIHHIPMAQVQGRLGQFWSCHEKNLDGSWCSYRPAMNRIAA